MSITHLKCNLFKTMLLIFSPKRVPLTPFSTLGWNCRPASSIAELFVCSFFSFSAHLMQQESCVLQVQNVPASHYFRPPPLAPPHLSCHRRSCGPCSGLHHCSLLSLLTLVRHDPALQPGPSSRDIPPLDTGWLSKGLQNLSGLCSDATFSMKTSTASPSVTIACPGYS